MIHNPDETDVTSFLCRLALNDAPLPDPLRQTVATDNRTFIPEGEAAYWEAIAEAYRLYVEQQDKRMAEMTERFRIAEDIHKLAIANLQGQVAALEGRTMGAETFKRGWWRRK